MKFASFVISYIRFCINLIFWIIGWILLPINFVIISLKNKIKITDSIRQDAYDGIKFKSSGNLKHVLKRLSLYDKNGFYISEAEMKNGYFALFNKEKKQYKNSILLIIPEYSNNIKNTLSTYKKIRHILNLNKDTKILINRQTKKMFWAGIFYRKLIFVDVWDYSSFSGVILLNNPNDKNIDKFIIPNISLISNNFYCYYNKYIADEFPWINFIKNDSDISEFGKLPKWVDNFGYDEILNKNIIGAKYLDENNLNIFKNNFLKNYLPNKKEVNLYYKNYSSSKKIAIVFPIYRNWLYLKCRSFKSCLFNKCFVNLEFYFVEDELNNVKHEYMFSLFKNIKFYNFNDQGSGSPARPRNKGVKLAMEDGCDYLCFLDPDNTYVSYALDEMTRTVNFNSIDICAFNMWTFGKNLNKKIESENKWEITKNNCTFLDANEILKKYNFICFNMQQLIIDLNWFKKNAVFEQENTLGEDMIFWYELVDKNPRISFLAFSNTIYFNYQMGSLTNNINEIFFEKSLNGYKYIYEIFITNGSLNDYINSEFYKNYYNGLLSYWKNEFTPKILDELYNTFKKFDSHNVNHLNSMYRKKIINFFKKRKYS